MNNIFHDNPWVHSNFRLRSTILQNLMTDSFFLYEFVHWLFLKISSVLVASRITIKQNEITTVITLCSFLKLFVDKDTIMNAVSASHDTHLLKIDNKVRNWCIFGQQWHRWLRTNIPTVPSGESNLVPITGFLFPAENLNQAPPPSPPGGLVYSFDPIIQCGF